MAGKYFLDTLGERLIILDGAMGTSLQRFNLSIDDFHGHENCNEVLNYTRPEIVGKIHDAYFSAGADAVETNTFGATRLQLDEFGLGDRTTEINLAAARIARESAAAHTTSDCPRYVVGSIGSGTKSPSLGHITYDALFDNYYEQALALIDGGADALLIETCFDLLHVKATVAACDAAFRARSLKLPLMVQVTIEKQGTMLTGADIATACSVTTSLAAVDIFGVNCGTGPVELHPHIEWLSRHCPVPISCLPNAGLPEFIDGRAHFPLAPADFAQYQYEFVTRYGVQIAGGCCGTTFEHIAALASRCAGLVPPSRSFTHIPCATSSYSITPYAQEPRPLIVGEETNSVGSKRFREFLKARDYDAMVQVGREQQQNGAAIIDVCVALAGEDETEHMTTLISRLANSVNVPLMVDSTDPAVLDAALKLIPGKPVINSINLEDGEERVDAILPLALKYGASVVALTIDEKGMAKTAAEKFAIASRIYTLCVDKWRLDPADLIFDPLTFTLASGESGFRTAAIETIEAIRRIKSELPGVHTILGVSNISFGLKPAVRPVLNSVFLHYAVEAGLDLAIINSRKVIPLFRIPDTEREAARRLVFNESESALLDFIRLTSDASMSYTATTASDESLTPAERLRAKLLDGDKTDLRSAIDAALQSTPAQTILDSILLPAMREVGDLMAQGEMQLPFVLQSAEVMKDCVTLLEPFLADSETNAKGTILLATVRGDVHDIGKNLVEIILRNNGYKTYDIGIRRTAAEITDAVREYSPTAVGLSGLLVKSAVEMKNVVETLNREGLAVPVICGGAALTESYVNGTIAPCHSASVAYASDAFDGLKIMDSLTCASATATKAPEPATTVPEPPDDTDGFDTICDTHITITFYHTIPQAPFYGPAICPIPPIDEVFGYINERLLFRKQFGVKNFGYPGLEARDEKLRTEVYALRDKAVAEGWITPAAAYGYFPCVRRGDSLSIRDSIDFDEETALFTFPRANGRSGLCLSDFFMPEDGAACDVVAFQAVTAGAKSAEIEKQLRDNFEYKDYLYLHGLLAMTAEALADIVHKRIRAELGFADDCATPSELIRHHYRSRRYSFGYAACPDLAGQQPLLALLGAPETIPLTLTDSFMLVPEHSTTAIVVHHPQARYFSV